MVADKINHRTKNYFKLNLKAIFYNEGTFYNKMATNTIEKSLSDDFKKIADIFFSDEVFIKAEKRSSGIIFLIHFLKKNRVSGSAIQ